MIFTVAGETVDSCVFHSVAFVGVYAPEVILVMIGSQILFKTLYEIVMYPITRKVLLAVRKHAGLNGLRSQARRFVSFPTVLKWGSEGNRNPFDFVESVRGLIRFGVEANGVAGDICSADDANHLTFVHNRSFLKMMLGKRCAYGSHVVLQVNSKDVFGCNRADFHADKGAGFFFKSLFI